MRALVQRVRRAAVSRIHDGSSAEVLGQIGRGLAILVGVRVGDTQDDARTLAERAVTLRIFEDTRGKINLSILDVGGEVLSVPEFTLYADTRRGRRPSFSEAAPPDQAEALYQVFNQHLETAGIRVIPGIFRTHMLVEIHNDGPVTILLDSQAR
jgi:D-tyrosyl-tRNA(Tyr) deacylase